MTYHHLKVKNSTFSEKHSDSITVFLTGSMWMGLLFATHSSYLHFKKKKLLDYEKTNHKDFVTKYYR